MNQQPDLFSYEHKQENNPQSDAHYSDNVEHFNNQCAKVLKLLRDGYRLTSYDAMVNYGIGHLARRIADLKQAGIKIQDRFIPGERIKEYWI